VGDPYDLVNAGTEFWRVYRDTFLPASFKPLLKAGRVAA
jgi:hypothetical protein